MFQRRSYRSAPRARSLALGGALAAAAVVGGGTLVAVTTPAQVDVDDILLAQNDATVQDGAQDPAAQDGAQDPAAQDAAAQQMPLGVPVDLDLEPVVARAAGGEVPDGTEVQITGLPDGLVQNDWVISGTPTRAGEYDVLVTVSNSGISRSQKVAITVVDEAGAGAGAAGAEGADAATAQPDPDLSAVPGDPSQLDGLTGAEGPGGTNGTGDGVEEDGLGGDDDEVGTTPDLCAVLGGGQVDGDSLASLLPMVVGEDDAGTTGLVMVVVNTLVNLLPSVLGESGSLDDLGSAGEFLCTLSPSMLGQPGGETDGEGDGLEGAAALDGGTELDGGQGVNAGAGLDAGSLLDSAPALLGLLGDEAGDTGM